MLEAGCHLEEDQREQMDKDVEDLLAIRDEFKNRRFLVHLLYLPFQPNKAPFIINTVYIIAVGHRPFTVQKVTMVVHFSLTTDKTAGQLQIVARVCH